MYEVDALGIRISRLRKEKNMTQEIFANKLGVSPQAVSKWETGIGYPDITLLPGIADTLEVTMDQLFGQEVSASKAKSGAFVFPESRGSLRLIGSLGETACYADIPGQLNGCTISFSDGSEVNLETKTVTNHGQNKIILAYADDFNDDVNSFRTDAEVKDFSYTGYEVSGDISGDLESDKPHIDSYNINILGSCKLFIIKSKDNNHSWEAEGSPDFMESLNVEQVGNSLFINTKPIRRHFFNSNNIRGRITLYCPLQNMSRIDATIKGTGDISSQINFEESDLKIQGSGQLKMLDCGLCQVSIAGSGDFKAMSAHNAEISIAGSGNVDIDLVSGKYNCKIAGSGDLDFRRGKLEELRIRIAGSGKLDAGDLTVDDLDISLQGGGDAVIGRVTGRSVERISRGAKLTILNRG